MIKKVTKWLPRIILIVLLLVIVVTLILSGYSLTWTGFGDFTSSTGELIRSKTLWDWMQLILVPIVLFVLASYYSEAQRKSEEQRRLATEHAEILQTYLDKMQNLVLDRELLKGTEGEPVVNIARTITLTTLERLDAERRTTVLIFLDEMRLIQGTPKRIINLTGADFAGVGSPIGLGFSDLSGVDLSFADLQGAKLDMPNFQGANLEGAILEGANFIYGDFRGANLSGAELTNVNMYKCLFDERTTLPNGERWSNTDMSKFGAIFKPPFTEKELRETRRELGIAEE